MKWGIRRTPEELGHRKAEIGKNRLQKYKDDRIAKIEKLYAKNMKTLENGLAYDPENKDLKRQIKELKQLQKRDIDKVKSMSYTDVVNAKKQASAERREKAGKIAKTSIRAIGGTTLWGARMALIGVRAYGTFKAVEIAGAFATKGIEYLQSPEGQKLINTGFNAVTRFMKVGDMIANIANPDLSVVIDANALADKSFAVGEAYVRNEIQKRM